MVKSVYTVDISSTTTYLKECPLNLIIPKTMTQRLKTLFLIILENWTKQHLTSSITAKTCFILWDKELLTPYTFPLDFEYHFETNKTRNCWHYFFSIFPYQPTVSLSDVGSRGQARGALPPRFLQTSKSYPNQSGQIMPPKVLLAPLDFWTFRHPWASLLKVFWSQFTITKHSEILLPRKLKVSTLVSNQ